MLLYIPHMREREGEKEGEEKERYYSIPVLLCLTASTSMIPSRSIQIAANCMISFFLIAKYYFTVYIHYIFLFLFLFFTPSPVLGHLGCFQTWPIVSSAAKHTEAQRDFLSVLDSWG